MEIRERAIEEERRGGKGGRGEGKGERGDSPRSQTYSSIGPEGEMAPHLSIALQIVLDFRFLTV